MSTCTMGSNRSPGHLFLDYIHTTQALPHKCSVRIIFGVDITDIINLRIDANDWALKVAGCMTTALRIDGWGVRASDGSFTYAEPFATSYLGLHGVTSGMQDARSSTLTFTGRGFPAIPGNCTGPARLVIHTGAAYLFTPGLKSIANGVDTGLDALAAFLLTHEDIWADYYGQPAGVNGKYPVQYNATVQKRFGT